MIASHFQNQIKKPNRLKDEKNEQYHVDYAKWAIRVINSENHRLFTEKAYVNWCFFKGQRYQWIYEEDMAGFFLDDTGNPRHRIRISYNLIKPMVQQFVGNAVRLDFNATAQSLNDLAKNKLEERLNRLFDFHDMIDFAPGAEEIIREQVPLGRTREETEQLVRLSKTDEVTDSMNNLLTILAEKVDIAEATVRGARYLCLSGMAVYFGRYANLNYEGSVLEPWRFFWDIGAKKSDLSDAEYMGHWDFIDVPYLLETYNLTDAEQQILEAHSTQANSSIHQRLYNFQYPSTSSRVPVYHAYWKDVERKEYGWVRDKDDYICLKQITGPKAEYSPKDLVPVSELSEMQLAKTEGKNRKYVIVDVIRCCVFTPAEDLHASGHEVKDIVYEYGILEFQEEDPIRPESSHFPYKVQTWIYEQGEVLTPLDDAIDPQRLINRMVSVQESSFNRSHGSGAIVASEAIDDEDGDVGIAAKINRGEMITVRAQNLGSVHNAVGKYESNSGQVATNIQPFIENLKTAFRDITAVNESMTGTMGGGQALVGVVQEQINQGTIVQEPFYYALTRWLQQIHQNMAQVGRKVYVQYPKMLALIAGDRARDILTVIDDLSLESWRIFIKRSPSRQSEIQMADELIFALLQVQMIDQNLAAQLLGRSTRDLVYDQLRKYQGKLAIAQEEAARQQEEIAAAQAEAMAQEQQRQQMTDELDKERDQSNKEADRMMDYLKAQERNETSIQRDLLRNR